MRHPLFRVGLVFLTLLAATVFVPFRANAQGDIPTLSPKKAVMAPMVATPSTISVTSPAINETIKQLPVARVSGAVVIMAQPISNGIPSTTRFDRVEFILFQGP